MNVEPLWSQPSVVPRRTLPLVLFALFVPLTARAQTLPYAEYEDDPAEIARPDPLATPGFVRDLETSTAIPPCGGRYRGRSILDGGQASRRRDPDLPCRDVWQRTVRFELGLLGGGVVGRGDGGWGGLSLSLGLRLHEYVSVYYLFTFLAGRWGADTTAEQWEVAGWSSFLFELSPAPRLGIAVGPSIDFGAGCTVGGGQTASTCFAEPNHGAHGRVTLELLERPHGGLALTLDGHLLRRDGERYGAWLLGLGWRF